MQVSNNFSLYSLMTHECNLSRIDSHTVFTQYGLVGFQSKTYTGEFFPQGKYFHSIDDYDKHRTCPYTRIFTWNPEVNWTTPYSSEFLKRTIRMEIIHFRMFQKPEYNLPLTARNQFYEMGEIDVIENIYLKEICDNSHRISCHCATPQISLKYKLSTKIQPKLSYLVENFGQSHKNKNAH